MAQATADLPPTGLLGVLRRFPLISYFVTAVAFSWAVVIVVLLTQAPQNFVVVVAITFGPTFSAFLMTGVLEGRAGVRRLLERLVLWRVNWVWYAFSLVGIPLIFIAGTVFLPGAAASFDGLTLATWLAYPKWFLLIIFVGGPLLEEPGWRGFALPRLQARFGPLAGTLILAFFWAAWHYPQYMMPDWAAQNGGFNLTGVTVFTLGVFPLTIILTWVFNNTRGSLLIAVLAHASIDAFSLYIMKMFPAYAASQVNLFLGVGTFAVLLILLTWGRLGYDKYLAEVHQHPVAQRAPAIERRPSKVGFL
jgi:membrane protease YdiL (CAAX protease family)